MNKELLDKATRAMFMNKETHWQFDPELYTTKEVWTQSERDEYDACQSDAKVVLRVAIEAAAARCQPWHDLVDGEHEGCNSDTCGYACYELQRKHDAIMNLLEGE